MVVISFIVSLFIGLQFNYFINYACPQPTVPVVSTTTNHPRSPLHIAFGLPGNHSRFLSEFEVAIKSLLLHVLHHRSLIQKYQLTHPSMSGLSQYHSSPQGRMSAGVTPSFYIGMLQPLHLVGLFVLDPTHRRVVLLVSLNILISRISNVNSSE